MALREDIPAQIPTGQNILPEEMAPDDLENELFGPKPEAPAGPPPQKVMIADASGSVPLPDQRTPDPLQRPAGDPTSTPTGPNQQVYGDDKWTVMMYVLTQGGLPWLRAAYDVASGRVPPEQFEDARVQHSKDIEAIVQQHPDFTQAAQKAAPFVTGLGLGVMKPAATAVGTVARGVGAGAAMGAAQGFTSGDPEEPTLSAERFRNAGEDAVAGGVMGGAGAGVVAGARGAMRGMRDAKRARLNEDMERTNARLRAEREAAMARRQQVKQTDQTAVDRTEEFKSYSKAPEQPGQYWEANRKAFDKNPSKLVTTYAQSVENPSLQDLARQLNLPQAVVAAKLKGVDLPADRSVLLILHDIDKVNAARQAAKPAKASKPRAPRQPKKDEGMDLPGEFGYKQPRAQEPDVDLSSVPYRGPAIERARGDDRSPPTSRPPYTGGKPKKPRAKK